MTDADTVFQKNRQKWNEVAYFLLNNKEYTLYQVLTKKDVYSKFVEWTSKNKMPKEFLFFK